MEKHFTAYYMSIPAKVWDSGISHLAQLLYGHISVKTNKMGWCWATNKHFEKILGVSTSTVTRAMTELERIGAIRREIIYKPGTKEIQERRIFLVDNTPIVTSDNSPIVNDETRPIVTSEQDIRQTDNRQTLNTNIINNKINQISIEDQTDGRGEKILRIFNFWNNNNFKDKNKLLETFGQDKTLNLNYILERLKQDWGQLDEYYYFEDWLDDNRNEFFYLK